VAINLPIVSTFDGKGVTGAIGGIQNLAGKLLGLGAIVAGAFAVRAIVDFGRESIEAAQAVEVANKRLEAVAKATQVFGAETGKVTDRLIEFAEAQEMVIATDAEVIKGVQAQLLSFKKLSESAGEVGGVFDRVTQAAFDMAAAGFGSAESNAIALGKAFEDPIKGLTALRRSGTVFTEEQQNLIRTLVESGDLLGAQTVILEELETQYGGTAEATATWADKLQLAFDNVKEAAGESLLPIFEQFAEYLVTNVIPLVTKFFEEDFPGFLTRARELGDEFAPAFQAIGDVLREAFDIDEGTGVLQGLLDQVATLPDNPEFIGMLEKMVEGFVTLLPELVELVPLMLELAEVVVPALVAILPVLIPLLVFLVNVFDFLWEAILTVAQEWGAVSEGAPDWTRIIVAASPLLTALTTTWNNLANAIKQAYEWWKKWQDSGASKSGADRFQSSSGGRAAGGMVTGGSMYAVGERGPELFIPNQNGTIIPNNAIGGSTYNITVNAGMGADPVRVGEYVVSAIRRYERASGKVFASA
jgi:phage-related protein